MSGAPQKELRQLYPPIQPFNSGFLDVEHGHKLYFEQCGNPEGKPVVFLHGGPGSGCNESMRCFFDPEAYHIVLFDQRGAGRSLPFASLENNTTQDLVKDMERLRVQLGIERWQVFGGSWGSCLALAYAEEHPDRVTELVLRGIFTLRKKELLWFYQEGASFIFPDAWEEYLRPIPVEERGDLIAAYAKRLNSPDEAVMLEAARAWSIWEGHTSKLFVDPKYVETFAGDKFSLSFARIENHYFVNGGFFEPEDQLIRHVDRIRHIPTVIVQGRYDLVCPFQTAWDLHKAFPEAEFVVVPDAGHSAYEPGILSALVEATDKFKST